MTELSSLKSIEQLEIERAFAAQAWRYPVYTISKCGWLRPDSLRDPMVRAFWENMLETVSPNSSDDEAAVAVTSASVVTGIDRDIPTWSTYIHTSAMPEAYASEIIRRAFVYRVSTILPRIVSAVKDSDDQAIRHILGEIGVIDSAGALEVKSSLDVAKQFVEALESGNRAMKTHTLLDRALGGLERQTLIVLAARPSMGKTAFAWQVIRSAASGGKKIIFFSLEMSAVSIWARAACPAVDVAWRDVLGKNIADSKIAELKDVANELGERYKNTIYIDDTPKTTDDVWRIVASMKPDLFVVDHIRFLRDVYGVNEVQRLGYIAQRLRDIAKASDVPAFAVAQLSRSPEARTGADRRPVLADLRDSGQIEENADVILMMYRDDYYNPTPESIASQTSLTEIWVRKFRDGPANQCIKMEFDKQNEWFNEISH